MDLITNRTQRDVDFLNYLAAKGWDNLSATEKGRWSRAVTRGAYNCADLNRVESAVAEIAEALGIALSTKNDWNMWDIPAQSDMDRYLGNIRKIKSVCPNGGTFPEVPLRMTGLTFEMANRIEEILTLAYWSALAIPQSGEIYCGEV